MSVSGYFKQADNNILAYKVWGNISKEKDFDDKIMVISNRLDGMWGETPGDSGVGGAIVLGIMKYILDNDITPKYNLTFLFTTGEEYGFRGAWHFHHTHPNDNIVKFIGLDQLAFKQDGALTEILVRDNSTTGDIIRAIINESGYTDETGYEAPVRNASELGAVTDCMVFRSRDNCDTITLSKDGYPWYYHHRTGKNYSEGDSMKNIDPVDVNMTYNVSWEIVKYYSINPDCWFESNESTCIDTDDENTYKDSIRTNFTVNTTLPHDRMMVKAIIHNDTEIFATNTTKFNVTSSGYNSSIIVTLPEGESPGIYNHTIFLYNSTGKINEIMNFEGINYNESNTSYLYSLSPYDWGGNAPNITNVSATPNTVGFGFNVTISADVIKSQEGGDIDTVEVIITDPVFSMYENFTMTNSVNDTYEYVFNNTWKHGKYTYVIWAKDENDNETGSDQHYFYVRGKATVSVCTIKDSYGTGEIVNLTDPPGNNDDGSQEIGYELLDDGKVLHIWNRFDSYFFNTSNGIQFTNHKDEYWSHNVLMLGYYNNDVWNLIYRTDSLNGFNKKIESDNETYVNATLWKDLTYGGYDFRLAIRYHLGVDDNELTVIPYIKNLDEDDIPYVLGFGWEIKDIQVDMTPSGDYIEINGTSYYLNQSLDETYKEMDNPCYFIREDISDTQSKSLYLRWNNNLNYRVRVKSRNGQYNAPVSLFIRIGTLDTGQEKYTEMYWYDADQITYYFEGYDDNESWSTNPGYMVDGDERNYASTSTSGDVELCDNNTCNGTYLGVISKVELRCNGYRTGMPADIILRPVYNGEDDGSNYTFHAPSGSGNWSEWFNITSGPGSVQAHPDWSWIDVVELDCDVQSDSSFGSFSTLYCSKVEVRVTYTTNFAPVVSNPYPEDDSIGITTTPMLNITISDLDGDPMNITWLSNSSGSWQVFGTNNSVGNGTYHQVFSNASVNGQWWNWSVNVTDGKTETRTDILSFYTGYESKIHNTGTTNISGHLLIRIDYYNETSEEWEVDKFVIDEKFTRRVINISEKLPLDTIFNPENVNTSSFSHGNGTYRVYSALRDPWNNVLRVCDTSKIPSEWWYLEDSYEFTVTGL